MHKQQLKPQEIFEYKLKWRPGTPVGVHSDKDLECRNWCIENLQRHQWHEVEYTDIYEHTFCFELQSDAIKFKNEFADWLS